MTDRNPSRLSASCTSPVRMLLVTTAAVFLSEAIIMAVLPQLELENRLLEGLLDACAMSVFAFLLLRRFAFRPLVEEITERRRAEEALEKVAEGLELRVAERTRDLELTNRSLSTEVVARQEAEAQLRRTLESLNASLREKEALLKEVYHRVNNNLQVMGSLLNLQADQVQDASSLAALRECRNRVRTLALIHEKLYRSKDLTRVPFRSYVKDLTTSLLCSYFSSPGEVSSRLEIEDVHFDVDIAIPLGLVVNEIISCSLQHFIACERRGEVVVELRREGEHAYRLVVGDDGDHRPAGPILAETGSLGIQLVSTLVKQIDGTVEVDTERAGTAFVIRFATS